MFYRLRRIRKLFPIGFHAEYVYEHRLESIPVVSCDSSLEIRCISEDEVTSLLEVWNVNLDKALARLNRGDLCFAGFLSGRIASYHWVQYFGDHFVQQAGRTYPVLPGEGWIYHVRVAEWARGRNINGAVYAKILEDARSRGKKVIHVYTSAGNTNNQKGLLKCGFKLARKLISFRSGQRFTLIFVLR